ncbi:hypothetical protein SK128_010718 [Halocaridina rubra]|uniref:FAD dependent oxidoreductase domain-containing protein n=1 Tax=Halocaridina rubra TaxID=373956 RepID=A0AAN8X4Y1_HALRR
MCFQSFLKWRDIETKLVEEEFDVCVVGGGVMGSCAAYSLAEAGKSTVLIEQFPIPHTRGSSSGHSRITSLSDYRHPFMASLVNHGYKQWLKLQTIAAEWAVRQAPVLTIGTDEEVIKHKGKRIESCGFPPTRLTIADLNAQYKSQFPSDRFAVIDPSGLVLVANKCVLLVQKLFKSRGGVILDGCPVKQVETEKERIRITCPRRVITCKSLVLCPGPWAKELLGKVGIKLPLRTLKTGVWYFKLRDPSFPPSSINDLSISNEFFYATRPFEYPGLIKFGVHDGVEIDPGEREKCDLSHLKKKMTDYLEEFFPQIEPQPSIEESCMYTMTPDSNFILDYHPKHKNIVYACGFSGTGFQLGPAIGEVLAGMVLDYEPIHDMTPFRASRFNLQDEEDPPKSPSATSKY